MDWETNFKENSNKIIPIGISIIFYLFFRIILHWKKTKVVIFFSKKFDDELVGNNLFRILKLLVLIVLLLLIFYILVPQFGLVILSGAIPTLMIILSPAKTVLEDMFSYLLFVTANKSFQIGDEIIIGNYQGRIEEINLRLIKVHGDDGSYKYVYNHRMEEIINCSKNIVHIDIPFNKIEEIEIIENKIIILNKVFIEKCKDELPIIMGRERKDGGREEREGLKKICLNGNKVRYACRVLSGKQKIVESYLQELILVTFNFSAFSSVSSQILEESIENKKSNDRLEEKLRNVFVYENLV